MDNSEPNGHDLFLNVPLFARNDCFQDQPTRISISYPIKEDKKSLNLNSGTAVQ